MYAFFIQIIIRKISISVIMVIWEDWEKKKPRMDLPDLRKSVEKRNLFEGIWRMLTRLTTEDIRKTLRYMLPFHIEAHHELYTVPIPGFSLTEHGWHAYQMESNDYDTPYTEWLRKEIERQNLCLAIMAKVSRLSIDDARSVYAYIRTFNPPPKTPHY